MRAISILCRNVILEAWRGGLPWLAAACVLGVLGLGSFLAQVAVTESALLQLSINAALLRIAAVFLVIGQVASSTAREHDDKGLELMLALPIPRTLHYLGRWAGHVTMALALSACFCLPLLLWSTPAAVAAWGLSLAFELALAAAAALFFSMTLGKLLPALSATAALYLLARTIDTIQSIAAGPAMESSPLQRATQFLVDALALALPRLDMATRAEWLLYGAPQAGELGAVLVGLALYAVVLVLGGLVDFQRRNL